MSSFFTGAWTDAEGSLPTCLQRCNVDAPNLAQAATVAFLPRIIYFAEKHRFSPES